MPAPALIDASRYMRAAAAQNLVLPSIPGAMGEVLVAPENVSPVACQQCGHYQPQDLFEQAVGFKFRCHNCATILPLAKYAVDLQAGQERWLDESQVLSASWYHVSLQENWLTNVQAAANAFGDAPMVHVGSRTAAVDRARDIGRRPLPVRLYEVRLRQGTTVAQGLFKDEPFWPKHSGEVLKRARWNGYSSEGATRYLNHYEAPGSVSLIVNCAALELVQVEVLAD